MKRYSAKLLFQFRGDLGSECDSNEVWYDFVTRKLPSERRDSRIPKEGDLNTIRWERRQKKKPNKTDVTNPAIAPPSQVERKLRRVGDPRR